MVILSRSLGSEGSIHSSTLSMRSEITQVRFPFESSYPSRVMPQSAAPTKLGELTKPAEQSIAHLLSFPDLQLDHWLMRLSVASATGNWESLAADTATNDRWIKERIAQSGNPVTELAVGYVGMIDWRGSKRLMAYLQYFKADHEQGLLCLRHVKEASQSGTFEGFGGFLVVGACKNTWI
jgi:hypothetical protein